MVKMHNLRRTAADVKAEKKAAGGSKDNEVTAYIPPEDDGARFELNHHHLTKMGLNGDLKSGDRLHFHGDGTVERSESRSSPEGERHSATIRFHKGGVDHEPQDGARDADTRADIRSDIAKAAEGK